MLQHILISLLYRAQLHCLVIDPQKSDVIIPDISFMTDVSKLHPDMTKRANAASSILAHKTSADLSTFSWRKIVQEMKEKFPMLLVVLCGIMLGANGSYETILPQLGMIYGLAMKTRNRELSLVQKMVSVCMFDAVSDAKVFDRLQRCGVAMSYNNTITTIQQYSSVTVTKLVEAVRNGKYIRFIGDNLNFFTNVRYERLNKHGHMHHMFATAIYIYDREYTHKPHTPEINLQDLKQHHIMLKKEEYSCIRSYTIALLLKVISRFIPYFKPLAEHVGKAKNKDKHTKTVVVPIEVLPYNEMKYIDVVNILLFMKMYAENIYNKAGVPFTSIHTGGDQLTRERFSHAKEMRLKNMFPDEQLQSMTPVTMEFFHLMMNLLHKVIYKNLYSERLDQGTLHHAKETLHRNNVDPGRPEHYEANKEMFLSYFRSNLIEAVLHYFGMDDLKSEPTRNVPANTEGYLTQPELLYMAFRNFVDEMIFPSFSGKGHSINARKSQRLLSETVELKLCSGQSIFLQKPITEEVLEETHDYVQNYARATLELGSLYVCLLDCIKGKPNRNLMIYLVKMLLPIMKASNKHAKYPLELLRFLIQQYSLLSVQQAYEVFNACFVNTKGFARSYIPADQQMEWLIAINKRHLKHLFSQKNEGSMQKRSKVIHCVHDLSAVYDNESQVFRRAHKHKRDDSEEDELVLLRELRKIKPFDFTESRSYEGFKTIQPSLMCQLDACEFAKWFEDKKLTFTA